MGFVSVSRLVLWHRSRYVFFSKPLCGKV